MDTFALDRAPPDKPGLSASAVIAQVRDRAMFMVDRRGRIASWNEGVGRILGWTEDDWLGQPLRVAFTAEDASAGVAEDEMRTADTHGRADDKRWMLHRDGQRFFALGALTRLDDAQGLPVGYLKVLVDLTAQKTAEQERERLLGSEQEARASAEQQAAALTAAVDAIADGVCIGDATGYWRANAAALALWGVASADDLRIPPPALVERFRLRRERDGPLLDPTGLPLLAALQQGAPTAMELWATQVDSGRDVFMRCVAAPILVGGHTAGAVVVHGDLTERLQLGQAGRALSRVEGVLQQRDAELRALVDGVRGYAIFTISPQGRINSWHIGAALMTGYSADEAIGLCFDRLFTPEQCATGRPACEMDIAVRCGVYEGNGLRLRKDGSSFEAAVVLTPLFGADGTLQGFLKLAQDITERKRAEADREAMVRDAQAARAEAERVGHAKGEFLATISHELRTPLSAILGWANVLERGVLDAETIHHGLAAIARNARTQVQLIEDLLDMNRIEAGTLRLEPQRVELGGVIAAAIDSALPSAIARGIGLRAVIGAAPGVVAGDAMRLQQVVGNLLNNAIKFSASGGQVSVMLTQVGSLAQVAVADNGQGIDAEFLARIFHRFQQQDPTITRRHGGLGLGLAIVRHLVELHGGTVSAHSAGTGLGATFTISLPLLVSPAAAGTAAPAPTAEPPTLRLDGVKVLLIDDQADGRTAMAHVLQQAGAQVPTAASAQEGLQRVREEHPAVVLCDIGMPGADGYDFIRSLRQLAPQEGGETPAAAFTAYARAEDRQRALGAGYQMHIVKPVAPAELVAAVRTLLPHGGV